MKKLIVLFAAIAFNCSVYAQTATTPPQSGTPGQTGAPMVHKMKDMIMMRGGKVMMFKDGKMMPMDKETSLTNGDKVMMNGTIMKKDGTTMTMKDGDRMDMDGRMMPGRPMSGQNHPMQQTQPTPLK